MSSFICCVHRHVPCLPWAFLFFGVIGSSPIPRGSPLFGEIRSPNYPKPYPNDNSSSWDIQVPKGYVVKLAFKYFDLEPSESCFYDYVKVRAQTPGPVGAWRWQPRGHHVLWLFIHQASSDAFHKEREGVKDRNGRSKH